MSNTAGRDPALQAIADKVGNVLTPKTPDAVVPPAAVVPTTPETPPAVDAGGTPERGPDGKFQKKELSPEARGLLAGLKAEREKRKESDARSAAAEKRIADLEARLAGNNAPREDRRADLLKTAPEDTQKFWKDVGDPVVRDTSREEAARLLDPYKPTLEAAQRIVAREKAQDDFRADLGEFLEDMALEGQQIDPVTLVNTIERFETQYGITLGNSNRKKFENAVNLLVATPQAGANPARTEVGAQAAALAEAAAKARAGGVAPGSQATVPPPDTRTATQKGVREMAHKGDLNGIAHLIGNKLTSRPAVLHPLTGKPV